MCIDILISIPPITYPLHSSIILITLSQASTNIEDFHETLSKSKRILALCGAGLSAASGLDTFRGKGGMWRNYQATALATPEAFENDPGLVVSCPTSSPDLSLSAVILFIGLVRLKI
jgi:Sir2 family